ncbi:hypothetical protein AAVH_29215 [Aphelenchoides avenae]|nr:hypothetical protein AAVH_29215 [Aphelenchus avenae]
MQHSSNVLLFRFWLFEYRGYYDEVPRELLLDDAELAKAILENRTCLAGHTENHTKLHPLHCDEKLPAVCYSYRQTAKHFCEQKAGKVWTLFQGKCFYVYSSPSKDREGYISYFDAQQECLGMNATLATVTDEATFKRTLDLATGIEKMVDLDDGTWIGLQIGGYWNENGMYYFPNGTTRKFPFRWKFESGHHVGWWEEGTPYNHTALKHFWCPEPPQHNEDYLRDEFKDKNGTVLGQWGCSYDRVDKKYEQRCKDDRYQHCTQIFPGNIEDSVQCKECRAYSLKWNDRWCYYLQRGYICQRDADSETDPYRLNDEL